jgi:hypothetical protein
MKSLEDTDFHGYARVISAAVAGRNPDSNPPQTGLETDSIYTFANMPGR